MHTKHTIYTYIHVHYLPCVLLSSVFMVLNVMYMIKSMNQVHNSLGCKRPYITGLYVNNESHPEHRTCFDQTYIYIPCHGLCMYIYIVYMYNPYMYVYLCPSIGPQVYIHAHGLVFIYVYIEYIDMYVYFIYM